MDDDEFLRSAEAFVDHECVLAALAALGGLSVDVACARHGGRPKVVNALLGRLKRAVVEGGRVTSARDYVDPFEHPAIYDVEDVEVCAAFAIFRTLERPPGRPMLLRRGYVH